MNGRALADHPKGADWVRATVVRLFGQEKLTLKAVSEAVGFSIATVNRITLEAGLRRRTPGVKSPRAKSCRRVCSSCGKVEMIRSDHRHTRLCLGCAPRFAKGNEPFNKDRHDRAMLRTCKVCGVEFYRSTSYMTRDPNYRWGSYCSVSCYGLSMQTPGSRYSEVGTDFPSRRRAARS